MSSTALKHKLGKVIERFDMAFNVTRDKVTSICSGLNAASHTMAGSRLLAVIAVIVSV